MIAKSKKVSSTATTATANKVAKVNGIAKKEKKPKKVAKVAKESAANEAKIETVKSVPTGKHIVFDDEDKPVAAATKKTHKKGPKENVNDIGKRWYEEVMCHPRGRPHDTDQ